jgi:23S rRNA (cytidine1920-2'-O)/16S rRNA (cytidine1409-2'-O)-methyltransferase
VKLAAALDHFGIDPAGHVCLDVGASTGGFTEVLLSRDASRVYAVDVGRGQLHPRLAEDKRVVVLEQTDARRLDAALVPQPVGLCVVDVSFISLRLVIPQLRHLISKDGYLVALIKPQFEAGRENIARGGIVRDETIRQEVLHGIATFAAEQGYVGVRTMPSPIEGGDGNHEFLMAAHHD